MHKWDFTKTETDTAAMLAAKKYQLQVKRWTPSSPAGCVSHNGTIYLILRTPKCSAGDMKAPAITLRDLDMKTPHPSIYTIVWKAKIINHNKNIPSFDWSVPDDAQRRSKAFYDTGSRKIISYIKTGRRKHAH